MPQFTCLPTPVANWLQVLRPMLRHRHHLVFGGFLGCQGVYQEKSTVKGLARLAPRQIATWHLRRRRTAAYGNGHSLLGWFVDQVIAPCPHRTMGYVIWGWIAPSKTTLASSIRWPRKGGCRHKPRRSLDGTWSC
jgi:hypothetical protein